MNEKIRIYQIAVNILQEAGNKLKEDEGFFSEAGNILLEAKGFSKFFGNILQEDEGVLPEAGNKLKEEKGNLKILGNGSIFVETFSIADWENIKFPGREWIADIGLRISEWKTRKLGNLD